MLSFFRRSRPSRAPELSLEAWTSQTRPLTIDQSGRIVEDSADAFASPASCWALGARLRISSGPRPLPRRRAVPHPVPRAAVRRDA